MKNVEPSGRLFQVQTTLEPAAARAISRRTRFEGEASADEAYSPGSGAVQVSGRWKCAILCPTTRPVRKTHKSIRVRNPNGECLFGSSCGSKPVDPVRTPNRKNCQTNHLRSRTDLAWPSLALCANPLMIYRPRGRGIEHDARYGGSNGCPSWPFAQRNFER